MRSHLLLSLLLLSGTTITSDWTSIESRAKDEIYGALRRNADDFTIEKDNPMLSTNYPFTIYGDQISKLTELRCSSSSWFRIISPRSQAGYIGIGQCKNRAEIERAFAKSSIMANELRDSLPMGSRADFEKIMSSRKSITERGAEVLRFTMMSIGHGIEFITTIAVFPRGTDNSFLMQFDPSVFITNVGNPKMESEQWIDVIDRAQKLAVRLFEPKQ